MDQIVFSGKADRGLNSVYYDLRCQGFSIPLCFGSIYRDVGFVFRGDGHHDDRNLMAWGFSGHGPQVTAISILAIYARVPYSPYPNLTRVPREKFAAASHIRVIANGAWVQPKGWKEIYGKHPYLGDDWIKKHYKAFTEEVIAKLPDKWTLTEADIDQWVKKQEEKKGEKK